MELMFANKIVWLICYKLEKYFSNTVSNMRVIVAMGADSMAGQIVRFSLIDATNI